MYSRTTINIRWVFIRQNRYFYFVWLNHVIKFLCLRGCLAQLDKPRRFRIGFYDHRMRFLAFLYSFIAHSYKIFHKIRVSRIAA